VSNAQAAAAFPVSTVDDSDDDSDFDDEVVDDQAFTAVSVAALFCDADAIAASDIAFLDDLSPVEREMNIQVEYDLFPGCKTTKAKTSGYRSRPSRNDDSEDSSTPDLVVSHLPYLFERELVRPSRFKGSGPFNHFQLTVFLLRQLLPTASKSLFSIRP
jgi:hypothetical protein